jgi:hypothetical protein
MGDVVTVNTKDLFEDTSIDGVLKVDHDESSTLEVDVDIEEINTIS